MSALSEHVDERRNAATTEGRPVIRLAAPSVIAPIDPADKDVPIESPPTSTRT